MWIIGRDKDRIEAFEAWCWRQHGMRIKERWTLWKNLIRRNNMDRTTLWWKGYKETWDAVYSRVRNCSEMKRFGLEDTASRHSPVRGLRRYGSKIHECVLGRMITVQYSILASRFRCVMLYRQQECLQYYSSMQPLRPFKINSFVKCLFSVCNC